MSHNLPYFQVNFSDIPSLQESCFHVIKKEISRFTTAFEETQDEHLKMGLILLQRKYTKRLIQELIRDGNLKECNLNFLLNDYVEDFQIYHLLKFTSQDYLLEKLLPIAKNIDKLSVWRFEVSNLLDEVYSRFMAMADRRMIDQEAISCINVFEKLIPSAKGVHEIHMPFICTDNLLKLIATSCSQLTVLDISHSSVSGEGLKAFYTSPGGSNKAMCPLKSIDLSNIYEIDEEVATLIENFPSLEVVKYDELPGILHKIFQEVCDENNSIRDQKKYNLTKLVFDPDSLPEQSLLSSLLNSCSKTCPLVRDLEVMISKPQDIELCCLFQNLEQVYIHNCASDFLSLNSFLNAMGPNLKDLTAIGFKLSVSILIEMCPKLESCTLDIDELDPIDRTNVKRLWNLKFLKVCDGSFHSNNCAESVILLLNSSPNLETLEFHSCKLLEADNFTQLMNFSSNVKLKELYIIYSSVSCEFIHHLLLNCNSLIILNIDSCSTLNAEDFLNLKQIVTSLNKNAVIDSDKC